MRRHTELQHMVIVSLRNQPQTFLIKDLSFQLTQLSAGLTFPELIIQITFTHMFSALFCFYVLQKVIFNVGFKVYQPVLNSIYKLCNLYYQSDITQQCYTKKNIFNAWRNLLCKVSNILVT